MSFDAGEIKAYLVLDRSKFNEGLDQALADAKAKTEKGVDVKVKPELDETAMDEVLAEEEPLRKDIEPQVKPSYAKGEAESVGRAIGGDIIRGMEGGTGSGPYGSLIGSLLGQGLTRNEIGSALKNMGLNSGEIKNALGAALGSEIGAGGGSPSLAQEIVRGVLPSGPEMSAATAAAIDEMYSGLGPPALGGGHPINGGDGLMGKLIAGMLGQGATEPEIVSGLKRLGFSAQEVVDAMGTVIQDTSASVDGGKGGGFFQKIIGGLFGSGGSGGFANSAWGFLSKSGGGPMSAIMNPIGISAGTAFLGAFGAAISGGIAATIIGSAGTMAALLPGFLDLMHGYSAYQAISTGGSTKGMSPGSIGLGKQIGGLLGAGSKGLGAAEKQIFPDITKFVNAITKALPLMNEFATPAIKAMSGFFNVIDKGMGSSGFKVFVGDMSKLVGPIMTQFGQVILNLGKALGGFLKLFGGVGAKQIGPWFVKITGEFAHFMNHVKLGHGFIQGMVTVFSNLGKVLQAVWPALLKLGEAFAPIGMQVFRIVGWMAEWVGRIIKLVPTWLVTAILGLVLGLKGVALAIGLINAVMDMNPFVLIGLAVIALGLLIYELIKHWRAVWNAIKRVADDVWQFLDRDVFKPLLHVFGPGIRGALNLFKKLWDDIWGGVKTAASTVWHFLDNDIFKPLGGFFGRGISTALNLFKRLWDTVWNGIKDTVKTVWTVLRPIFNLIANAIHLIAGGISGITGVVGSIGGAASSLLHSGGNWNPINWFADGGQVAANQVIGVGENGPELFVPSTAGTIIPNGSFGGNHIMFQIDARGHTNPQQVVNAVRSGIGATLPMLQAALARGAA